MPPSALCDATPGHTMWDEVEVQWFVSNGITLKFPCQASLLSPQTVKAKNAKVSTPLFAACVIFMEQLVCAFQLNSLQAGLRVCDSQIISIIIIRWQETHCRRSARVKIGVKLFHSPLSSFCIRAVCCIHNALDCVSVRLCVFSISLLSVHHWSEWPSWHSANSRQGHKRASH